jgi:predicted small integral membrane protein
LRGVVSAYSIRKHSMNMSTRYVVARLHSRTFVGRAAWMWHASDVRIATVDSLNGMPFLLPGSAICVRRIAQRMPARSLGVNVSTSTLIWNAIVRDVEGRHGETTVNITGSLI